MLHDLPPSPAFYPFKMIYSTCNWGAGTPSQQNSCTQRHDDTLITLWYAIIMSHKQNKDQETPFFPCLTI